MAEFRIQPGEREQAAGVELCAGRPRWRFGEIEAGLVVAGLWGAFPLVVDLFPYGDGGFHFRAIERGGIEEGEHGLGILAADHVGDHVALHFERFPFVRREGEALFDEQEMQGRGRVVHAAGGVEVGGAAGGEQAGRAARNGADRGQDAIEVFFQNEAEEVVQVPEQAADGELGDAGGVGELGDGDAITAEGDEVVFGRFEHVGASRGFPWGWGGPGAGGFRVGAEEAGGDDCGHGSRVG